MYLQTVTLNTYRYTYYFIISQGSKFDPYKVHESNDGILASFILVIYHAFTQICVCAQFTWMMGMCYICNCILYVHNFLLWVVHCITIIMDLYENYRVCRKANYNRCTSYSLCTLYFFPFCFVFCSPKLFTHFLRCILDLPMIKFVLDCR